MALHYSKGEVAEKFEAKTWQNIVFKEIASALNSSERAFPCSYGVSGFKSDQLRYAFISDQKTSELGLILSDFLANAKSYGFITSLIVFYRPGPVTSIEAYRTRFWDILHELSLIDVEPWPQDIPHELSDSSWEFCFAGEPVFVNCNTPAHIMRQSRRSSTFTLVFQPRWIFDNILTSPEVAEKVFKTVRGRINNYDMLPAAPVLGRYGEEGVLEYEQYFLADDNEAPKCPFANLGKVETTDPDFLTQDEEKPSKVKGQVA